MTEDNKNRRLMAWKSGQTPGPWQITVFPTYRCNLRCACCPHSWSQDPPELLDEISDERWLRLVDEAAELGVREWLFAGGGEPMVRDKLVLRMCARIRERGMNGVIQTNGVRFAQPHLEELVRLGWDWVGISLDGPNAEIHDAIRSAGMFARSTQTVRSLADLRRRHGVNKPGICIPTVVTALNYDKLDRIVEMAHELGADTVEVNDLIVFDQERMKDLSLTAAQRDALPGHAARALRRAEELGIVSSLPMFLRRLNEPRPEWDPISHSVATSGGFSDSICFEAWLTLVIVSNGLVSPCCIFWEHGADNIRDTSLAEVWHGPYMERLRADLRAGKPRWGCSRCAPGLRMQQHEYGAELKRIERRIEDFSVAPGNLVRKVVASLRKNGLRRSLDRGCEFMRIRRRLKRDVIE